MQALNVQPASILPLINEVDEPPLNQKTDKVKVQEANILQLQKPTNMKRLLEAYSDCV